MKASPDEVARASEAVVLGADTILADGSVVNGVPSRALAQAARDTEKPVFIVAEIAKIDFDLEIAPVELEAGFEVVPAAHITAIITEQGAIAPNAIRNLAR